MSNLLGSRGEMARGFTLYVGVLAGLVFCSEAVWNTTEGPSANTTTECQHHSNQDNCTDTGQWNGHFSPCPEEFTYYCVHGECRYIKEMKQTSCRCDPGFFGARCELLDIFDKRIAERKRIIIICVIVGLVLLIFFVIFICCLSHRRGRFCKRKRRQRDEPRNGTEKLHMDVTLSLIPDSTEQPCS